MRIVENEFKVLGRVLARVGAWSREEFRIERRSLCHMNASYGLPIVGNKAKNNGLLFATVAIPNDGSSVSCKIDRKNKYTNLLD